MSGWSPAPVQQIDRVSDTGLKIINQSIHAGRNSANTLQFKSKSNFNLKVIDVFSIIDSTHILHQYVQLAANFSSYIDGYSFVPFKNSNSHLKQKHQGANLALILDKNGKCLLQAHII